MSEFASYYSFNIWLYFLKLIVYGPVLKPVTISSSPVQGRTHIHAHNHAHTYSWSATTLFNVYKTPGAKREMRNTQTSTGGLIVQNVFFEMSREKYSQLNAVTGARPRTRHVRSQCPLHCLQRQGDNSKGASVVGFWSVKKQRTCSLQRCLQVSKFNPGVTTTRWKFKGNAWKRVGSCVMRKLRIWLCILDLISWFDLLADVDIELNEILFHMLLTNHLIHICW